MVEEVKQVKVLGKEIINIILDFYNKMDSNISNNLPSYKSPRIIRITIYLKFKEANPTFF